MGESYKDGGPLSKGTHRQLFNSVVVGMWEAPPWVYMFEHLVPLACETLLKKVGLYTKGRS